MKCFAALALIVFSCSIVNAEEISLEGGFDAPESIIHIEQQDVYLVSNMGGTQHSAQDNNGFISRVSPDGTVEQYRWIAGGEGGVELNAPTGMAVIKDTLWVVDYNVIRSFSLADGSQLKIIEVPDAGCLNDITVERSALIVSDCGLNDNFVATGTDAIWRITTNGGITERLSRENLKRPNGLAVNDVGDLYWAGLSDPGVLHIHPRQGNPRLVELPHGGLDGIVVAKDKVYVSSWSGKAIYQISNDKKVEALANSAGAADIGWDAVRQRLLIPVLYENRILLRDM